MNSQIEAIDLFCGIGGLSYGLKRSGIEIRAGLDDDLSCKYAFERNVNAPFIHADIANYDISLLKDRFSKGSVKVLVGCAPCQPFSAHIYNKHHGKTKQNDTRWNLIKYFTQAVEILSPDIISMENVRGFTRQEIFTDFLRTIKGLGYQVDYKVVFCPDYGIPQNRYRLVLLGSKKGEITIPTPTDTKETYKTVSDAVRDLPEIKAGGQSAKDPLHKSNRLSDINLRRIKQSKPKGTWKDWDANLLPDCYKKATGQSYTSVYGRMAWDEPAPTITTQFFCYGTGRFGHPEQDRALSIREGALLQTFPQSYDFGMFPMQTLGRHIGNAVPPRLGEVIGQSVCEHIEDQYAYGK